MKGVIFNYLEEFICQNFGPNEFDLLLERCSLRTVEPFVGPGTYPDEDMLELVTQFCASKSIPINTALKLFGAFCFPKLSASMPGYVEKFTHPKPFLQTIESVIHSEVNKLYQDAKTPVFDVIDIGPRKLKMVYRSKRKLCPLVEGLFDGVGKHFNNRLDYVQTECCHQNSAIEHCTFHIEFEKE